MGQNEPVVIGVDVGGTKVLIGCVTRQGEIVRRQRWAMDRSDQGAALTSIEAALDGFMSSLGPGPAPLALGVGVVGQVDPATGTWVQAMNIPIGTPVPLAAYLQERYRLPVAIDNDVHAATLAEQRWGAGRGVNDFVYLSVGTGLAAGLVCNGQLVRGAGNYAGELGHMVVEPDGDRCQCGRRGCLEPIASGGGMIAQVEKRLGDYPDSVLRQAAEGGQLTSSAVFQAADAGDPLACCVAERAVRGLGAAVTNIVNLLNPELVVLGGGVFADGWLVPRLRAFVAAEGLPAAKKSLRQIVLSPLQADLVGLLGAATLAWEPTSRSR